MTLLVYLGHPAHYHLFKNAIKRLKENRHHVIIAIKSKDVLERLLKDDNLPYINVDVKGKSKGFFANYTAFFRRLNQLRKIITNYRPKKLAGSAAELAILGKYFNIPSYIFFEDDFEAVPKFAKIAGPLATRLICPNCCSAWKWNYKKTGYNSYHELAYLHPNHFTPDAQKISDIFDLNRKNFILRFAQLTAYHDVGKSGINTEIAQKIIDVLSPHGNVFITSERPLEPQFEKYRIHISPLNIHHALYFADMYIGDSQTMTAEAAVMGTPALRFNDFVGVLSYLEELEHKFSLTHGIKTCHPQLLLNRIEELLNQKNVKEIYRERAKQMLKQFIDFSELMVELLEK